MTAPIQPDDVSRIIVLAHGLMEDRGRYWCYVAVKPSRHQEFKSAIAKKYNIQNFVDDGYGEVIVSGRGGEPPADVTQQVADMFGVKPETFFTDPDPDGTIAVKMGELPSE